MTANIRHGGWMPTRGISLPVPMVWLDFDGADASARAARFLNEKAQRRTYVLNYIRKDSVHVLLPYTVSALGLPGTFRALRDLARQYGADENHVALAENRGSVTLRVQARLGERPQPRLYMGDEVRYLDTRYACALAVYLQQWGNRPDARLLIDTMKAHGHQTREVLNAMRQLRMVVYEQQLRWEP